MEIVGVYEISYPNANVKQRKNLVLHERFIEIKEGIKSGEIKDKDLHKKLFGDEFFTTQSPIYGALLTNALVLPENQGGSHDCTLKQIS